jgi:hypothetical protein
VGRADPVAGGIGFHERGARADRPNRTWVRTWLAGRTSSANSVVLGRPATRAAEQMLLAAMPAAFCGMPRTSGPTMTSSSSTAATPLSTLATPTHPRDDFIPAFVLRQ